ncbi:hypothetical protein LQM11_001206 [Vibrio parahaemolyticus]|nr:hypothetical protein [Vibrio parahaemolyticus]EIO4560650.1 hypothetical protein [Vibrio parahaemolyticus]HBC3828678.1 hypothetical protein [Vibrio parahaemolyticus]
MNVATRQLLDEAKRAPRKRRTAKSANMFMLDRRTLIRTASGKVIRINKKAIELLADK